MLITPAIASEPYCAAAPSRSTSIRLIARPGIRLRSTAALPRPTVPLMLSSAETWRRLPLTRTRVWSGLRPRSVAGPQRVGAVGDRRLREVERRHQLVEDLVGLGLAGVGDLLGADHVDRDRAVGDGAVGAAGAGDDDRLLVAASSACAAAPAPALRHSAAPADWSARRPERRARAAEAGEQQRANGDWS